MTLKEFCSVYGGMSMNLYIPRDKQIFIDTWKEYRSTLDTYGNYRVTYFDVFGVTDYQLNITIEK